MDDTINDYVDKLLKSAVSEETDWIEANGLKHVFLVLFTVTSRPNTDFAYSVSSCKTFLAHDYEDALSLVKEFQKWTYAATEGNEKWMDDCVYDLGEFRNLPLILAHPTDASGFFITAELLRALKFEGEKFYSESELTEIFD